MNRPVAARSRTAWRYCAVILGVVIAAGCSGGDSNRHARAISTPSATSPVFPKIEVRPGVNNLESPTPAKPLFEIRGTGSQTSRPLVFSTTDLVGGVVNNGPVKISIVPVGQKPEPTTRSYYDNPSAGSGGAFAKLAGPGRYVVVVEASTPDVQWTMDIYDGSYTRRHLPARPPNPTTTTQPFPKLEVTPGLNRVDSGTYKPLFSIRGTGSQTSPPLVFSTTQLIGGVDNNGPVKVWIVPVGQKPVPTTRPYYTNGAGGGGATATLAGPGRYVVIVEAINPSVRWTVDIDDLSDP